MIVKEFFLKFSMKKLFALFLVLFLFPLASCNNTKADVVTTNFICYDATRAAVGSEDIKIDMLIKPGLDIHSYEPSAADIRTILDAKVFVYVGGESDELVETTLLPQLEGKNVKVVSMFEVLEDELLLEDGEEDEYDEHVWTNPLNYKKVVESVGSTLKEVYPAKASSIDKNVDEYTNKLTTLDNEINSIVSSSSVKSIVVADRFPFLYFCSRYNLDYLGALSGCSQDTNVPTNKIVELKNKVEEKKLRYIFILEMSNGRIASSVKGEIDKDIANKSYDGVSPTIEYFYSVQDISKDDFNRGYDYLYYMNLNKDTLRKLFN